MSYPIFFDSSSPQPGPSNDNSPQHASPGTDPTFYSPMIQRDAAQRTGAHSPVTMFTNEVATDARSFVSRYLHIDVFPVEHGMLYVDNALSAVEKFMKEPQYESLFYKAVPLRIESRATQTTDVYIRFDGLNDAIRAKDVLVNLGFAISFITPRQYCDAKFQETSSFSDLEAQVRLVLTTSPPTNAYELLKGRDVAQRICNIFGPTKKIQALNEREPFIFRIEFDSVDAATRITHLLANEQRFSLSDKKIAAASCSPWRGLSASNSASSSPPSMNGYPVLRRHANDQHNRVRRERIVDGSDIRTTVMLRNIPNKMDWLSLKQLLDEFCFGTYDFVYLRIDFNTGCNVGYAFINFVDTTGMIAMVDHIENRGWSSFRSAKAAEISYATIQGKEALVAKFRNSSVMKETAYCRPRLFHSFQDARANNNVFLTATEMRFPAPDNLAKLNRSMESARSTGLYPPNGSGLIDHRTRTGLYDNGNPRDRFSHGVISQDQQRAIEHGYMCANGFIRIPFAQIPRTFIDEYLAKMTWTQAPVTNVGVIGRPTTDRFYGTQTFPAHRMVGFTGDFSGLRLH